MRLFLIPLMAFIVAGPAHAYDATKFGNDQNYYGEDLKEMGAQMWCDLMVNGNIIKGTGQGAIYTVKGPDVTCEVNSTAREIAISMAVLESNDNVEDVLHKASMIRESTCATFDSQFRQVGTEMSGWKVQIMYHEVVLVSCDLIGSL